MTKETDPKNGANVSPSIQKEKFDESDIQKVIANPISLVAIDGCVKNSHLMDKAVRIVWRSSKNEVKDLTGIGVYMLFAEIYKRMRDGEIVVTPEMIEKYNYVFDVDDEEDVARRFRALEIEIDSSVKDSWIDFYCNKKNLLPDDPAYKGHPEKIVELMDEFAILIWRDLREQYDPIAKNESYKEITINKRLLATISGGVKEAKTFSREDIFSAGVLLIAKYALSEEEARASGSYVPKNFNIELIRFCHSPLKET